MLRHKLRTVAITIVYFFVVSAFTAGRIHAQDDGNAGLYFSGELSTVSTFGNSESLTLGEFRLSLQITWSTENTS